MMKYSGNLKISQILPANHILTQGNIAMCAALYIWQEENSAIVVSSNNQYVGTVRIKTNDDYEQIQMRSRISYEIWINPTKELSVLGHEYLLHPAWRYICLHFNFDTGNLVLSSNGQIMTKENITIKDLPAIKDHLRRNSVQIEIQNSKIGPVGLFVKGPNETSCPEQAQNMNFSQWQFNKEKGFIINVNIQQVCELSFQLPSDIIPFQAELNFANAVRYCANIGHGQIVLDDSLEWTRTFGTENIWYPAKKENGSFVNFYTGVKLTQIRWYPGEPTMREDFNCVLCLSEGCFTFLCDIERKFLCQANPIARLRGLCLQQQVGTLFYGRVIKEKYILESTKGTYIRYDPVIGMWVAKNVRVNSTSALSGASNNSFLLGTHPWNIVDPKCYDKNITINISLTACFQNEYNCRDGGCIPMDHRCDGINDCQDYSDEDDCMILNVLASQISQHSPINASNRSELIDVAVAAEVRNILDINDKTARFRIRAKFDLSWTDARLKFFNLKKFFSLNSLNSQSNLIWKPRLVLENQILADLEQSNEPEIMVDYNGLYQPSFTDSSDTNNNYVYDGKYNKLVQNTYFR